MWNESFSRWEMGAGAGEVMGAWLVEELALAFPSCLCHPRLFLLSLLLILSQVLPSLLPFPPSSPSPFPQLRPQEAAQVSHHHQAQGGRRDDRELAGREGSGGAERHTRKDALLAPV